MNLIEWYLQRTPHYFGSDWRWWKVLISIFTDYKELTIASQQSYICYGLTVIHFFQILICIGIQIGHISNNSCRISMVSTWFERGRSILSVVVIIVQFGYRFFELWLNWIHHMNPNCNKTYNNKTIADIQHLIHQRSFLIIG